MALQPNLRELHPEKLRRLAMLLPPRLQPLLRDNRQGLPHPVTHIHRRRMMVRPRTPRPAPHQIRRDRLHIQIPVLDLRLPLHEPLHRARRKRQRTDPRRTRHALLRPRVRGVHPPLVQQARDPGDGRHAVREKQGAGGVAELADAGERLARAGGGLGVDQREDSGLVGVERGGELFDGKDLAPGLRQRDHLGAVARRHVRHAMSKVPVDPNHDLIPRLQ
mmetsp:Transcript_26363/g.65999  ORF Transcript_26363/g.65999 Transcript_26363/m.65999 type:complete len:220 (+) Transcript_26363:1188-1847(+)